MSNFIEELEQKRERLNHEAEQHKRNRDKLNKRTKEWAEKRDHLNDSVRKLIKKANEHREKRDKLNGEVREAKKVRETLNKEYNKLSEELQKAKKEQVPKDNKVPISKLKGELRKLEFKHQTSVLEPSKEKDLVDQMKDLMAQISERERVYADNAEIRDLVDNVRKAKEEAETQHRHVGECAEKAQSEHDDMVGLYEEADKMRKEADEAQEKFIEAKTKADEEHRQHIILIRQVHDFDKIISGLRQKDKSAKKGKKDVSAKKEGEEIYERFKRGEKLSTEDLMTLQKAGYL